MLNSLKKYIKGLKFLLLVTFVLWGTAYFIRRADLLTRNVDKAVKNSLIVEKKHLTIKNSIFKYLTTSDRRLMVKLGITNNTRGILKVNHICRINDTLNSVIVFVDQDSIVQAIDSPVKIHP
jgi:hypothetical protein